MIFLNTPRESDKSYIINHVVYLGLYVNQTKKSCKTSYFVK